MVHRPVPAHVLEAIYVQQVPRVAVLEPLQERIVLVILTVALHILLFFLNLIHNLIKVIPCTVLCIVLRLPPVVMEGRKPRRPLVRVPVVLFPPMIGYELEVVRDLAVVGLVGLVDALRNEHLQSKIEDDWEANEKILNITQQSKVMLFFI